jgi:hypothetical protein
MIDRDTVEKLRKLPLERREEVLNGLAKMLAARPQHGGVEELQDSGAAGARVQEEERDDVHSTRQG